jgi:hypothetical protein
MRTRDHLRTTVILFFVARGPAVACRRDESMPDGSASHCARAISRYRQARGDRATGGRNPAMTAACPR